MNRVLGTVLLALVLAGCGGAGPGDQEEAIKTAVRAYSDAYLTGDADTAYGLLSQRCQDRIGRADFADEVAAAENLYGSALPLASFKADVNDNQARVTYTYKIAAINQTDEPWVKESGHWHEDDC